MSVLGWFGFENGFFAFGPTDEYLMKMQVIQDIIENIRLYFSLQYLKRFQTLYFGAVPGCRYFVKPNPLSGQENDQFQLALPIGLWYFRPITN